MKKHRGLLLALSLAAIMGLMASEARAATMTLSVYSGNSTALANQIFTISGTATQVTATGVNAALATHGFSAYTFGSLGGSSNLGVTGATTGQLGMAGNLSVDTTAGNTGADTPITIVVTESGFTVPLSAVFNTLAQTSQANYNTASITGSSTTTHSGIFTDSTSPTPITVTTSIGPLNPSNTGVSQTGGQTSKPIPTYVTPYTLTSQTLVSLSPAPGSTTGQVQLTNNLLVSAAIPEPASLVLMLTGMPLPLVVLGLLRRRRAAA
jgi:hypothetical protein